MKLQQQLRLLLATVLAVFLTLVPAVRAATTTDPHYDEQCLALPCAMYDPIDQNCTVTAQPGAATPTQTLQEFIKVYGQAAFDVGKQFGIPYEAIIAQAAIESGYGKSLLTTKAFNFFGIKAGSSWTGPVLSLPTKEVINGQTVTVQADFRQYANAHDGFVGYGQFITGNPRYAKALQFPQDPKRYIEEIKAAGYATDPNYVTTNLSVQAAVTKYIADNHLFPPSSQVTPDKAPPTGAATTTSASVCGSSSGTNGAGQKIVDVAKAELAKSPVEYDANVLKYTTGARERWCADFVSWVYKEAGVPFTGGVSGGWRHPGVKELQSYFKAGNGKEYFDVGSKAPQPGDVAFYIGAQTPDGGSTSHVNLVIAVSADGKSMTTIGGNEGNRVKQGTRNITLGADSLVGFGRLLQ